MIKDHIGWHVLAMIVLAALDGRYMRRDSCIHDDVDFTPVPFHVQVGEHFEAVANMALSGNNAQRGWSVGKGNVSWLFEPNGLFGAAKDPISSDCCSKEARKWTVQLRCSKVLLTSATSCSDRAHRVNRVIFPRQIPYERWDLLNPIGSPIKCNFLIFT